MAEKKDNTGKFSRYMRGVKTELRKVVWPSKKELINYSGLVLLMSAVSALAIFIFDIIINKAFNLFLR